MLLDVPPKIAGRLVRYSLPLLLVAATRPRDNRLFWSSIVGSACGGLFKGAKHRLVASSVILVASVFVPTIYFFSFGFALKQVYSADILISQPSASSLLVAKIEVLGLLVSEAFSISREMKLLLATAVLISSASAPVPCVEAADPFEEMKTCIEQATMLNAEYRMHLRKERFAMPWRPYFLDAMYMLSRRRMALLFCFLFSTGASEVVLLPIALLFALGGPWEPLCIFLHSETNENTTFRLASACGIYAVAMGVQQLMAA